MLTKPCRLILHKRSTPYIKLLPHYSWIELHQCLRHVLREHLPSPRSVGVLLYCSHDEESWVLRLYHPYIGPPCNHQHLPQPIVPLSPEPRLNMPHFSHPNHWNIYSGNNEYKWSHIKQKLDFVNTCNIHICMLPEFTYMYKKRLIL